MVELQHVVAGRRRRALGGVVVERAHAGIGPDHVGGRDLALEIDVHRITEVARLLLRDRHLAGIAREIDVGGADQREVILVGNRKDDAPVGILEDVGEVVIEELRHHDVRALHQAQRLGAVQAGALFDELGGPGPGGIHQGAGQDLALRTVMAVAQYHAPMLALAARRDALDPGQHLGAALTRVHRVQDHQARVLHPAVGIDEGPAQVGLERGARGMSAQIDGLRGRQQLAPAEVVVEEESEPDHPGRPQPLVVRQHETQRPDDVGRRAQQHLTLDERLTHQAELVVLEVAQAAVDQLGAGRGGGAGQIVFFAKQHREAAARRVAGDAGTVDATADHYDVENFGHFRRSASPISARFRVVSVRWPAWRPPC
jgi:hypothetical protein